MQEHRSLILHGAPAPPSSPVQARSQPRLNSRANKVGLLDREQKTLSDVVARFRGIMMSATQDISDRSDVGAAAYSSMQMDLELRGLIKSTEDLLSLTRHLRELWLFGPLRVQGEDERAADAQIDVHVQQAAALLNGLRDESRRRMMGPHGSYVSGPIEMPKPEGLPTGQAINNNQGPQQPPQQQQPPAA